MNNGNWVIGFHKLMLNQSEVHGSNPGYSMAKKTSDNIDIP